MIKLGQIKTELFDEVEITIYGISFVALNGSVFTIFKDGIIEVDQGENEFDASFSKDQFDEIIRVRQLIMEER